MNKFKVGDRVRITNSLVFGGRTVVGVITEVHSDGYPYMYAFQADYGQDTWRDDLARMGSERAETYDIDMYASELEPE